MCKTSFSFMIGKAWDGIRCKVQHAQTINLKIHEDILEKLKSHSILHITNTLFVVFKTKRFSPDISLNLETYSIRFC